MKLKIGGVSHIAILIIGKKLHLKCSFLGLNNLKGSENLNNIICLNIRSN